MERVEKAKTQAGKRHLACREAKVIENAKSCLTVTGGRSSSVVNQCLDDLYGLKKPYATLFKRKHPIHPFEDASELEKFSHKYDASLFLFGSHSKKRPHNLIIGRMHDFHVLDMFEFGIEQYVGLPYFQAEKSAVASKPCLIFNGDAFLTDPVLARFRNTLQDMFRQETVEKLRLQGVDHAMCFTVVEGTIFYRSYKVFMKKSGTSVPRIELSEMGPRFNLRLRRTKLASDDLYRVACKQPLTIKPKKTKNVKMDVFGSKVARVHLRRQNVDDIQTRKMRGLKKSKQSNAKRRRTE